MSLYDPTTDIKGLGRQYANKLRQFGIHTKEHLLFHFPSSYQNKTKITPLVDAVVGDNILLELVVDKFEIIYSKRKQLLCYLTDDNNDFLLLRFFYFNEFQSKMFVRGVVVQCFGEIVLGKNSLEMIHPQYAIMTDGKPPLLEQTLSPVYPNTLGIPAFKLKLWIKQSIHLMRQDNILDIAKYCQFNIANLPNIMDAITNIHYPKTSKDIADIKQWTSLEQKRLIIDELCAKNLALLQLKQKRKQQKSYKLSAPKALLTKLNNLLNFKLTKAQNRVINEIYQDLNSNDAMLRLLQGDVGSGKTIVAIFASLASIANNKQVAVMVPTEILAEQHFNSFNKYFLALGFKVILLVSSQTKTIKNENIASCKSGEANIIIGTHTLFQDSISFKNLGLVIIDEQHKFGVHQRLKLVKKSHTIPHQLIMTATPIPRSLAMSVYADLDTSIIDNMPDGRMPIQTIVLSDGRKDEIIKKIKQVYANNNQVYWVCTLIDESDILDAQSASKTFAYLTKQLPNINIELIHSKLDKNIKYEIMKRFHNKKIDVLISTTVIEVGVDVANASLMVIENAERLGLAQLHQLRGRVGRGINNSICILIYKKPLSVNAKARLSILRATNNGFLIAEKDLQLRGPGEILGTQQTGVIHYKIADIVRDSRLLDIVKNISNCMLKQDKNIQDKLINRWHNNL